MIHKFQQEAFGIITSPEESKENFQSLFFKVIDGRVVLKQIGNTSSTEINVGSLKIDEVSFGLSMFNSTLQNESDGLYSFSGGNGSKSTGQYSFSFGDKLEVVGINSVAFGKSDDERVIVNGNYSFSFQENGLDGELIGDNSIIFGGLSNKINGVDNDVSNITSSRNCLVASSRNGFILNSNVSSISDSDSCFLLNTISSAFGDSFHSLINSSNNSSISDSNFSSIEQSNNSSIIFSENSSILNSLNSEISGVDLKKIFRSLIIGGDENRIITSPAETKLLSIFNSSNIDILFTIDNSFQSNSVINSSFISLKDSSNCMVFNTFQDSSIFETVLNSENSIVSNSKISKIETSELCFVETSYNSIIKNCKYSKILNSLTSSIIDSEKGILSTSLASNIIKNEYAIIENSVDCEIKSSTLIARQNQISCSTQSDILKDVNGTFEKNMIICSSTSIITNALLSTINGSVNSNVTFAENSSIINSKDSNIDGTDTNKVFRSVIIGGENNKFNDSFAHGIIKNSFIIGGEGNLIYGGTTNSIIGSTNSIIDNSADRCTIIGGEGNIFNTAVFNSVILGGNNYLGLNSNTVYVPYLNIHSIIDGDQFDDVLVINSDGDVKSISKDKSDLELYNSWVVYDVNSEAVAVRGGFKDVYLKIQIKDGVFTDGTIITQLSTSMIPTQPIRFSGVSNNSLFVVEINTVGEIRCYGLTSNTKVNIDFTFRM